MQNRNFLFFINPISGTGSKTALIDFIHAEMQENKLNYGIVHTLASGNYSFLPEKIIKENITDIIICGGDGSINQIGAYLIGNPVRIGIIPLGSGNGLAFSAGISKNKKIALNIILKGFASFIDGFLVNQRFSCMLCGLGFDAKIAHEFSRAPSRGLKTYTRLTLTNWVLAKTYPFSIYSEGQAIHCDAYFISIANANQFGNNFRIAPKASLSDGQLDIIVVKKMNRVALLGKIILQIAMGKPVSIKSAKTENKRISYFRAQSLIIKNETLAPLHIDGEPVKTSKELSISIIPAALNLIQPRG